MIEQVGGESVLQGADLGLCAEVAALTQLHSVRHRARLRLRLLLLLLMYVLGRDVHLATQTDNPVYMSSLNECLERINYLTRHWLGYPATFHWLDTPARRHSQTPPV